MSENSNVIPLFGDSVPRSERVRKKPIEGTVEDLLSEPLRDSIADVENSITQLFSAGTVEEFTSEVKRIKAEVRRWPSG